MASQNGVNRGLHIQVYGPSIKKGVAFFSLQNLNLSSSYPKSNDESWSLEGRLQRPLTKRGSASSTSTLVTLSLTFFHSVSYSS